MKTLIIDNYDSFTYNLVHLLTQINQDEPLVVRNDEVTWADVSRMQFDNVVISPGPGRPDCPEDFGVCAEVIRRATVPLLGVCLGHQGVAQAAGSEVVRAPTPMHGRVSEIQHVGADLFADIPSPLAVTRYHSLVVARPLPDALMETAWTEDGLVMGIAHRHRPQWGVQFHPESITTAYGRKLLENFRDFTVRLSGRAGGDADAGTRVRRVPMRLGQKNGKPARRARTAARWQTLPYEVDTEAAFVNVFHNTPNGFWLDSSRRGDPQSRWSYLGAAYGGAAEATGAGSEVISYDSATRRLTIWNGEGQRHVQGSVFDYLAKVEAPEEGKGQSGPPCPFKGGCIGWFGYELRRECGSDTKRKAATADALLIRPDCYIAVDHVERQTYVVATIEDGKDSSAAERRVAALVALLQEKAREPLPPMPPRNNADDVLFTFSRSPEDYVHDIEHCLDLIGRGETYQVCLTNEISCDTQVDALDLYRHLRRMNPAPYGAFIKSPQGCVLSASPEKFMSITSTGLIESKPIKGTAPRDPDPIRDRELAEELRLGVKERAENLMIVDLLRNDLSRVCEPGSVSVPKLFDIESYATVHQLVSTVQGVLRSGITAADALRALFPGGSMTGAPKHRTMQFIDALENRPRGVYSGCLGWIGDEGAAELSMVIRAIVKCGTRLTIGAGGGIVAQSQPGLELDEMVLKAKPAMQAILAAAGALQLSARRR